MATRIDIGKARVLYLISDTHIDSPLCDEQLLKAHLERAKGEGAKVIVGGDVVDAMQTRHDPRRSFGALKAQLARDDYADALAEHIVAFFAPYRDAIVALADGNHETYVHRATQSYILHRAARELGVMHLPYRDLLRITADGREYRVWYAHGAGAHHAQVTRGVLDVARQAAWVDADVIWNGHTHTAYVVPYTRYDGERLRLTWAIRTPSYLRWQVGSAWADERGLPPQPRGCARVELGEDGIGITLLLAA